MGESFKGAGEKSGAMQVAIGNAMTAAADAVIDLGAKVIDVTADYSNAVGQMQAATGVSTKEMEKYEDVLKNVYAAGYGESFEDVANSIAKVTQNLGEMDQATLEKVTEDAYALSDVFGYDVAESTRAAKAMMDNFGIDSKKAFDLMATGAQNGLDYSGELLDNISEYSVQFSKVGLGVEEMFAIFQAGADSGAFNLDKIGDAVKEMAIRVVDGSDSTKEGFQLLGLNADEMAAKFAAGGDTAKQAFKETMTALNNLQDPLAKNQAGVDLFGTMWEDLGDEAVQALGDIEDSTYEAADGMALIQDVRYDDLGTMLETLSRQFEMLAIPIGEALIPLISELAEGILPILEAVLEPIVSIVASLAEPIGAILAALTPLITMIAEVLTPVITMLGETIATIFGAAAQVISDTVAVILMYLQPIVAYLTEILLPFWQSTFAAVGQVFQTVAALIGGIAENLKTIFGGIVDFVAGVFTGDWNRAWNGIKDIFRGIINQIPTILESVVNGAIDLINGLINGVNSLTGKIGIPAIPNIGHITLPRLKGGIDYVPGDFFPAFLDKGEMVLTAEEAQKVRGIGGVAALDSTSYGGGPQRPIQINVPLSLDSREVARATAWWMGEQLPWEDMS